MLSRMLATQTQFTAVSPKVTCNATAHRISSTRTMISGGATGKSGDVLDLATVSG
jgi:hypothetical protein